MKTGKKIQWGSISLLLLFILNVYLHHNILNPDGHQVQNTYEKERILEGSGMSSDYAPEFTGNGEDCNVTLQQSLIGSSPITISNASDPLNNTIYELCPTAENFPSSVVNMTIEDIYAPNKTLIIEDGPADDISDELMTKAYLTSFTTMSSCLLTNVSFELSISGSPIVLVYFYNSTWNTTVSRSEPDTRSETILASGIPTVTGWFEFDLFDVFLNSSNTKNNTWFIGLYRSGGAGTARWRFKYTGTDNSEVYWYDGQYLTHLDEYYLCKVGLAPYISPSKQTLIVEDGPDNNRQQFDDVVPAASSFEVSDNCFLENVSVELYNPNSPDNVTVRFVLYNSTWNSTGKVSIPYGLKNDYISELGTINYSANIEWVTLTKLQIYLDNSKTENNTWFIGLFTPWYHEGYWEWNWVSQGNGVDDTRSYTYQTFPTTKWILAEALGQKVDYHLKVDLKPPKNTPNPESINLMINNSVVNGNQIQYGAGYWSSTDEYSSTSGHLGFRISADWWDVSCTITSIQIIYTKTDRRANSNFTVENGQEVLWNVTDSEGLNYLDARINETATINFTIPSSWKNINVFNGTINRTGDVSIRVLNTGFSEIFLMNAGSGNWYLTASSENLMASIESYVGFESKSIVNYSDIVHFNTSFKKTIFQNDGLINLSIYSPALINDVLNFTIAKTMFGTGQEISLGDWDISDNVTQYGVFRVQVSWYNKTAVGFMEVNLTIIGESDIMLIEPPQDAIYDPNQYFNIIVFYEDVHLYRAIGGATINFNIANQGWESTTVDNGTTGYYLISVDCSELTSSGPKRVEITATREFYSTSTIEYIFELSESTTITTTTQPDTSTSTTTTTTTTTTTQPDTSTSTTTTTTTTTITETDPFPSVLAILVVFGTLVIFTRRRKKM
jgi:hypothetical protein